MVGPMPYGCFPCVLQVSKMGRMLYFGFPCVLLMRGRTDVVSFFSLCVESVWDGLTIVFLVSLCGFGEWLRRMSCRNLSCCFRDLCATDIVSYSFINNWSVRLTGNDRALILYLFDRAFFESERIRRILFFCILSIFWESYKLCVTWSNFPNIVLSTCPFRNLLHWKSL